MKNTAKTMDLSNYLVLNYNQDFHEKEEEFRKALITDWFDGYGIKEISFSPINIPKAHVHFQIDGDAARALSRDSTPGRYGFTCTWPEAVQQPITEAPAASAPRAIIIDGMSVAFR